MIDLHTHSLLSDGELLPCELVRRAWVKGYEAIAITDHADFSNIDFIVPRIAKTCKILNGYWKIRAIPGVEITHVPPERIRSLVLFARRKGAKIVVGHGETVSEPVLPGTNRAAIEAGVDILAHPGLISLDDLKLAKTRGVYLEITTRRLHCTPNKRLIRMARKVGAKLVVNTDSHAPEDLITDKIRETFLKSLGVRNGEISNIVRNSRELISRVALK
ncbi:MAG: histidinol phosphate phosphatase domain-containing protein [Candidatus Omnitrophota bacterium]